MSHRTGYDLWSRVLDAARCREAAQEARAKVVTRIKAGDPISKTAEFAEWLEEHKVSANHTYQVVLIDEQWMVVFQYATDTDGAKFVDKATGEVVVVEPYHVRIRRPVPTKGVAA